MHQLQLPLLLKNEGSDSGVSERGVVENVRGWLESFEESGLTVKLTVIVCERLHVICTDAEVDAKVTRLNV